MIFRKLAMGLTLSLSVVAAPVIVSVPSVAADVTYSTPTGLKTTDQTSSSIGLTWNAVAGAPSYRVMFSKAADMSNAAWVRSIDSQNSVDVRDLAPNTTYYFKVRVVKADGTNLSSYSPALMVKTQAATVFSPVVNPLSVATYNIHCANCNTDPAKSWINRRAAVVAQVKSKMPDVVGFQEASQGWLKDEAGKQINLSQFEDLQQRLNAAGAPYVVTNPHRNNCVKSTSPANCAYKDQGASLGVKIFYNKNTVTLLSQGSVALPKLTTDAGSRYVAWASFKQNSTGKSFFVTNAHLDYRTGTQYYELRKQQAEKIVQIISEKNTAKLPVLITGDMNSSKWATPTNAPYDAFVKAGYVDPIGGTWKTSLASGYATAEKIVNGRYSSYNGFGPNLGKTSLTGPRALGSHIDYIFTSKMRVAEWEQVLNINSSGVLQGQIPSDHNMIYAKVGLPDASTPAPTPVTQTPVTQTPIAIKAASLNGALGLATSKEIYGLRNGGAYQCYQRGCILYSPSSGTRVSVGAIRSLWASTGFENGRLGYPTSDEIGGLRNGGVYQNYQGGVIVWSPATGAHISLGGIRSVWASTGFQNGRLGYPTSNEVGGLRNGGVYQMYERGAIIWSPATGGFISVGGIRALWASTGFENGRLGYPTSNEYVTGPGGQVAQNYQGGTIHWSPKRYSIAYK
jgi:endonuclease/exonuclease/phosphatase family metal-dependent hydrolase